MERVEAVIIGGGPAGLSAALLLGRSRRTVIVFYGGRYRNASSLAVHGYLTRDGIHPAKLRGIARTELERYPTIELVRDLVIDARHGEGFVVTSASGREVACDALLLATGFTDNLPPIRGARELHGDRVVPCPYCDGWERRDSPLAAFSYPDDRGARYAIILSQWSRDVVMVAERPPTLSDAVRDRLAQHDIAIEPRRVISLDAEGEGVRMTFEDGAMLWRRAVFYHLGGQPTSDLAARLGAKLDDKQGVCVDRVQATSITGLFAAGDATHDVLQAIVAAGEGAAAGVVINEYLSELDR